MSEKMEDKCEQKKGKKRGRKKIWNNSEEMLDEYYYRGRLARFVIKLTKTETKEIEEMLILISNELERRKKEKK